MSQYYPQQPGSFYPPVQDPEDDDYYYDDDDEEFDYEFEEDEYEEAGDTLGQRALVFFAGGCLVFLCISCCALLGAGLWILDPGAGLVADESISGNGIGLTFEEPAFPGESVVNENNVQLALRDANRNASLPSIPEVEGREVIIVTVELVNLGDEVFNFSERNFILLNQFNEAYPPTTGAVDGSLGRGILPPGEGLEGRLVFEVIAGEPELILAWEDGPGNTTRFIYLE
jgi:hypothetical protein